ncbi:SirB2 family protein [Litoribrevibacter euphylliae]|uniref:SirB2 family protein n=1 Tax=Litoribrevibacter euphylliae TaxID=1834034 RepID=A0ABV7HJY4_9GAMM
MWLKHAHMLFALLSIVGFSIRGVLTLFLKKPLNHKLWKILPHINDTLLLAAAIGLLVVYQWNPFVIPWLSAKLIALLVYIGLGMFALKFGKTLAQRRICFVAAIAVFGYIVMTAISKQALWFMA